jgi:hypothetical protein
MIHKVTMYAAKCDECGVEAEFGDFTCYSDKDSVRTEIHAQKWHVKNDDTCICYECITHKLMISSY